MLAFIGSTELMVAAVVGLLLFGGRLPEVLKQVGRAWVQFRRALNELKRETGLEETLREIRREADVSAVTDWRSAMDHAAGPARDEQPIDTQLEEPAEDVEDTSAPAEAEPDDGPVPRSKSNPPE